jgi:hypothetical protein
MERAIINGRGSNLMGAVFSDAAVLSRGAFAIAGFAVDALAAGAD